MNKVNFVDKNPSLSTYWRSVILLGRNTASYKFALAKSLLENGSGQDSISIDELALVFAQNIAGHLKFHSKIHFVFITHIFFSIFWSVSF